MTAQHGVSSLSSQRVVMGPGKVYIGASKTWPLGATKGGSVLEINRTFRDIRPDGAKGKVKGYRFLENGEYTLTVKLLEFHEWWSYYMLAGSSLAAHALTGGDINNSVYLTEVTFDMEIKGTTSATEANLVSIKLSNCLVEGPFVMNAPEDGEMTFEFKFTAHYAATALTTEPFTITFTPVS